MTVIVISAMFALVGNLATNTVDIAWRWWPVVVWIVVALLLLISIVVEVRQRHDGPSAGRRRQLSRPVAPTWTVDRPAELEHAVQQLLTNDTSNTALTVALVALVGPGGYGKSTLARQISADPRVRIHFEAGVLPISLGREPSSDAALAGKINGLIGQVSGKSASFTEAGPAGERLGELLDGETRWLLVIDNVWYAEQLAPFLIGAPTCARLVTTRLAHILPEGAAVIRVGEMSDSQASAVVTYGLPDLHAGLVHELAATTGRWPQLLRLANRILANAVRAGMDSQAAAEELLVKLRTSGPAVVDDLARESPERDPIDGAGLIRATIGATTRLLSAKDVDRLAEIAVFLDGNPPVSLVMLLWHRLAHLGELEARQLLARLAELEMVTLSDDAGHVAMHDVMAEYFRHELGPDRSAVVHQAILHVAASIADGGAASGEELARVQWWHLSDENKYLWYWLVAHFLMAGLEADAERIATDVRWASKKLLMFGPASVMVDLGLVGTDRAGRMARSWMRAAHLFAPTQPRAAVVDIMRARLAEDDEWSSQMRREDAIALDHTRLVNRWPLPDLPDPALIMTVQGHAGQVSWLATTADGAFLLTGDRAGFIRVWNVDSGEVDAEVQLPPAEQPVALTPNGTRLITTGGDRSVQVWDLTTGELKVTIDVFAGSITAVTMASDAGWLATGGQNGLVQIWDVDSGTLTRTIEGHTRPVTALAATPDGRLLASASKDKTVRLWDFPTGKLLQTFDGHDRGVLAVAIAPDQRWLVSSDGHPKVWDVASGRLRFELAEATQWSHSLAIAPDGTWMASNDGDGVTRIWDTSSGALRGVLDAHSRWIYSMAVAPDGAWIATGDEIGQVTIWDTAEASISTRPDTHLGQVFAVAAEPGGRWFAACEGTGVDGSVRIWDVADGSARTVLETELNPLWSVAIAPDSSWLAVADGNGAVHIWDVEPEAWRMPIECHTGPIWSVAAAPDGSWLASSGHDGTIKIVDIATGTVSATLDGHTEGLRSLSIAPGGTWLCLGDHDGVLRLWDVPAATTKAVLLGHDGWILATAIAPDGSWMASTDETGVVRIWDVQSGQAEVVLQAHDGPAYCVAVAPDGTRLVTGGRDGQVRVWRRDGEAVAMTRVDRAVLSCACLPDGKGIAIGGQAGMYLFDLIPARDSSHDAKGR